MQDPQSETGNSETPDSDDGELLPHDPLLGLLVNATNYFGMSFPVTLFVGGTVVTGFTTPGLNYMKEVGSQVDDSLPDSWGFEPDFYESLFGDLGSEYPDPEEVLGRADESGDMPDIDLFDPPGHVHLEDARVLTGGRIRPNQSEGALWRGKLSKVDAFNYGVLSEQGG